MKRRDFLKKTFLFASLTGLATKAGLISRSFAGDAKQSEKKTANADVYVTQGKLGYKEVSVKAGKNCGNCSWYKNGKDGAGDCTLKAMKSAMKIKGDALPKVKEQAYCNMWKKIS